MTNKEYRNVIKAWFKSQDWYSDYKKNYEREAEHLSGLMPQTAEAFIEDSLIDTTSLISGAFTWHKATGNVDWVKCHLDYKRFLRRLNSMLNSLEG